MTDKSNISIFLLRKKGQLDFVKKMEQGDIMFNDSVILSLESILNRKNGHLIKRDDMLFNIKGSLFSILVKVLMNLQNQWGVLPYSHCQHLCPSGSISTDAHPTSKTNRSPPFLYNFFPFFVGKKIHFGRFFLCIPADEKIIFCVIQLKFRCNFQLHFLVLLNLFF